METMKQRLHELDCKVRQMTEERDNVVAENEELQDQLVQANAAATNGNVKLMELRHDVTKLVEEVNRLEYMCTSQEHELKTLSDRMCDLGQLKETVKEINEDSKTLKEDLSRVKTHLNVAAKLELQTQEKMYESRLYHLENVLEEMRQREGHFMRLAEETAVLKDQVDALRELSVISLKQDESMVSTTKYRLDEMSSTSSTPLRGISDLQLHLSLLRDGDKTLDKEIGSKEAMAHNMASPSDQIEVTTSAEDEEEPQTMFVEEQHLHDDPVGQIEAIQCSGNDDDHREELEEQLSDVEAAEKQSNPDSTESNVDSEESLESVTNLDCDGMQVMEETNQEELVYDNAKLMLMQTDEANSLSHKSSIKVTGTLKLMHPGKAKQFQEDPDKGCMPNCLFNLWAFFFD